MKTMQRGSVVADINITPLLDLAWVLLVIFILTTTTIVQGIDLKLPDASEEQKKEIPTETVTVSIDPTGTIFVNEEPMPLDQMMNKLRLYKLANPDLPVILRADKRLYYEQVVKVLDGIKRVPVENLAVATEVQ
ncbi:MAG TPA: biopolymer transporter ExbD [Myxococcota bacterium]|jgi:biopolymer transport protein ExbD|nr:biopolymer transporter ExbD [Myxococcota bacterium]